MIDVDTSHLRTKTMNKDILRNISLITTNERWTNDSWNFCLWTKQFSLWTQHEINPQSITTWLPMIYADSKSFYRENVIELNEKKFVESIWLKAKCNRLIRFVWLSNCRSISKELFETKKNGFLFHSIWNVFGQNTMWIAKRN